MNLKYLSVSIFSIIAFLGLYFSSYTALGNPYIAFTLCLILTLIPIVWSLILLKKDNSSGAIIFLTISGILLLFTLFMFLIPEAGNPPELFREH
ncbi:hypothetical protein ACIQXU_16520 [Peribacillus sp. NPDC097284]|uniref:hypothetical protein n=1 Tax=Peribacillus sp. NPDC097284 TaxID=3364401 RepID=UPI0037F1AF6E